LHKVQAVVFVQQRMRVFQWIMRRYYEPYLIYFTMFYYVVCDDEVTYVNGIKATEIQPYMHGAKVVKTRKLQPPTPRP
jgi:hypothetical protein